MIFLQVSNVPINIDANNFLHFDFLFCSNFFSNIGSLQAKLRLSVVGLTSFYIRLFHANNQVINNIICLICLFVISHDEYTRDHCKIDFSLLTLLISTLLDTFIFFVTKYRRLYKN